MRLTIVLNAVAAKDKLGYALNGLAHMSMGLGHRIKGVPSINVYFANDAKEVREFRTYAASLPGDEAVFNDFTTTMNGGSTPKQQEETRKYSEPELTYIGCSLLTRDVPSALAALTAKYSFLKGYTPYVSKDAANFLPKATAAYDRSEGRKIVMVTHHKRPLAEMLNGMVLSSLSVGGLADYSQLYLVGFPNKDGYWHDKISFHPYLVKKPSKPADQKFVLDAVTKSTLDFTTVNEGAESIATVVFGDAAEVDKVTPKDKTRLYDTKFPELVSAKDAKQEGSNNLIIAAASKRKAPVLDEKAAVGNAAMLAASMPMIQQQPISVEKLADDLLDVVDMTSLENLEAKIDFYIKQCEKQKIAQTEIEECLRRVLNQAASTTKKTAEDRLSMVTFIVSQYRKYLPDANIQDAIYFATKLTANQGEDVVKYLSEQLKPTVTLGK